MKNWILLLCVSVTASCSFYGGDSNAETEPMKAASGEPKQLDASAAQAYALYAMMASNAYLDKGDRTYFPIDQLGWVRVDIEGKQMDIDGKIADENSYTPSSKAGKVLSNMQYDIWEHEERPLTVISFKGTDEK